MINVEKGVFAAAAKKPAMPTMTKLAGCGTSQGQKLWKTIPSAPPPQPPMTIEGPKTPPEPPLAMVKLVVRILPRAIASRMPAVGKTAVALPPSLVMAP